MNPKISIITVCFNSEKHIEKAIRSVVEQTYDNIEYIIVDGGSSDKTLQIIENYKDKIARIICEPDDGISDAFNKGILLATGDIIGVVNSDDKLYDSTVIEKVANAYEDGIDVFRGSEMVRNYETGYEYLLEPTIVFKKNPIAFHVCHMATFIRSDAYEKYGYYDKSFKYAMDLELLCRFNYKGASTKKINVIVGLFRLGGVSQTYNAKKRNECERIIQSAGGTKIDALVYRCSMVCKDIIRNIVNVVGVDAARKIRYGNKDIV